MGTGLTDTYKYMVTNFRENFNLPELYLPDN
jgi:hypothetical protein